jgi:transposase
VVRQARSAGSAAGDGGPVKKAPTSPAGGDAGLEQENKQLRTRIRKLELERDILRRAAKYLAGETNW